jgi:hypothetical protein
VAIIPRYSLTRGRWVVLWSGKVYQGRSQVRVLPTVFLLLVSAELEVLIRRAFFFCCYLVLGLVRGVLDIVWRVLPFSIDGIVTICHFWAFGVLGYGFLILSVE